MRGRAFGILIAVLMMPASTARADGIVASPCLGDPWQCQRAPVSFAKDQSLPIEWQFDSGWIPPSSDLQVHLWGGVFATTHVELAGDVLVSWPDALIIETPGRDNGGLLGYHYGVETGAEGKVQITIANQSYNWQGDLPYVPQIDFQVQADKSFDAWGWAPGVTSSASTQPQTVAQIDVTGLIGPSIPGLSGGFELAVALDLTVGYVNERIVIERPDGVSVAGGDVLAADDASSESYDGAAFVELDVHPEGTLRHEGVLHLIPAFYIKVLGNTSSIPLADIPISLPADEQPLVFDPVRIHAPLPDLELDDAVIDFGEVRIDGEVEGQFDVAAVGEADVRMVVLSTDPDHFTPDDLVIELDAGTNSTRKVRFRPSEARAYLAVLALESNDPDTPKQMVLLKGKGVGDAEAPLTGLDTVSGCGCHSAGSPSSPHGWLLALALALSSLRVRRRPR